MKKVILKIPFVNILVSKLNFHFKNIRGHFGLKKATGKSPLRIVVGASGKFERGWTPTDINYLNLSVLENWEKYFNENSIDAILSEHVWEHLTLEDGKTAAKYCYKYLKPGTGYLRVAVPDGYHSDPNYIESVKVNGTGDGADDHKVLYNYKTFSSIFEDAGFTVKLLEYFDEFGNFHYNEWDVNKGKIYRSMRFDERNKNDELNYTSLIIEAAKVSNTFPVNGHE